jgi:hypothetical protein
MEQAGKEEQGYQKMKSLYTALSHMLKEPVYGADYQETQLHGGTLGDVKLLTGNAKTKAGDALPFRLVRKTQKTWERYGDSGSWRREYDLYMSELGSAFSEALRQPECYHAEINDEENEIRLWMEYIDGVSGPDLTGDMYEQAALELGRFQGRLYAEKPEFLQRLTNLSGTDYVKSFYLHYRSWKVVYDYVRSPDSELPGHICGMLTEIDENADEILSRVEKLPVVLCHRDFWVANIFHTEVGIRLIDWDTAGWGYMGEDMASLIADEADVPHMAEYYRRCVTAYYNGFSEYADVSGIAFNCVWEMMLLLFGYRLVEWFINAESPEEKALQLDTLQKIYEMRSGNA